MDLQGFPQARWERGHTGGITHDEGVAAAQHGRHGVPSSHATATGTALKKTPRALSAKIKQILIR